MSKAQDALDRGDVDEAIARFARARDLQPSSSGPYLGLGLANARAGRCDAAVPALEEYLKRKRDPKPEAVAALEDCRRRAVAARPARFSVTSTPPGAEVRVDEPGAAPVGVTPFEGLLAGGRHRVFVSLPGYQTEVRDVDAAPGSIAQLSLALAVATMPAPMPPPPPPREVHAPAPPAGPPGTLIVDVPLGGTITVNSVQVAESTKHYEGHFQRGRYAVVVERDGYRSATFTAALDPGEKVSRTVELRRLRSGAWLGLAIPMTAIALASGIAAIVTFYNADGHPAGPDFDTNATANAAMQGIFYPSLALAAAGYLAYGLLNRGKIGDGPPLQVSIAPSRSGGTVGVTVHF
jgi:hypothetical protein